MPPSDSKPSGPKPRKSTANVALPLSYSASVTLSYKPAAVGVANPNQSGNLFLPSGPKPLDGWPVLLHTFSTGWTQTGRASSFQATGADNIASPVSIVGDGLPWLCLRNGIAVYSMSMTRLDQPATVGGAAVAGRGLFKSPSVAEFATQDFPEKDVMWAAQMLRNNATTYGLNPDLLYGAGLSEGGTDMAFATYFKDMAGAVGFWPTGSTKLNGCITQISQFLFRAYDPTNGLFVHFPQAGATSPYNGTPAVPIGLASPTWLDDASVLKYAFETDLAASSWSTLDIINQTKTRKIYMATNVLPSYSGSPAGDPQFRSTVDTTWNTGLGYDAFTGAPGVNGGTYLSDPYHNGHQAFLLKQALVRNGVVFSSSGPNCRLVASPVAAHQSTWTTPLYEDKIITNFGSWGASGELTRDKFEALQSWIAAA
jgi:hypothetical protein